MATAPLSLQSDLACSSSSVGAASTPAPHSYLDPTSVVDRVRAKEESGLSDLYQILAATVHQVFRRQLGRDIERDPLHDVYVLVVEAIQQGVLRDPTRLVGFAKTVALRHGVRQIAEKVRGRQRQDTCAEKAMLIPDDAPSPEQLMAEQQRTKRLREALSSLSDRDREVLTRFYVQEQPAEQICVEMNLTVTQFRLAKSRAKTRLAAAAQRSERNAYPQLLSLAGK